MQMAWEQSRIIILRPEVRDQPYGLTTFRKVDPKGLGALCPPGALDVHDRVLSRLCTRSSAFWRKPLSIFGLVLITTFIERSHVFTIPSIQPRLRLMLADTPSPHGSGASQETVGTVSEGSVRGVTFPHICVGYSPENSRAIFIRGGESGLMSYC